MAKIYAAPIPPPEFDGKRRWEEDQKVEDAYIEALAKMARDNTRGKGPDTDLIGKLFMAPYADGKARYMIWSVRPLQMIHLRLGDAWRLQDYAERGINLATVRAAVRRDESYKELFGKKAQLSEIVKQESSESKAKETPKMEPRISTEGLALEIRQIATAVDPQAWQTYNLLSEQGVEPGSDVALRIVRSLEAANRVSEVLSVPDGG